MINFKILKFFNCSKFLKVIQSYTDFRVLFTQNWPFKKTNTTNRPHAVNEGGNRQSSFRPQRFFFVAKLPSGTRRDARREAARLHLLAEGTFCVRSCVRSLLYCPLEKKRDRLVVYH